MASPALTPCHPVRLAGRTRHHRDVSDTPRGQVEAPSDPVLAEAWRCSRRGEGCALPSLEELGALGFRYVVLDLPDGAERQQLAARMERRWGPPAGEAEGLAWWQPPSAPPGKASVVPSTRP